MTTPRPDRKRKGSPEWIRLGEQLAGRRADLSPDYEGHGGRAAFARERNINLKLVQDIELNARENITPRTLRDVIAPAYEVTYESIRRSLEDGGGLEPAPEDAPPRVALSSVPAETPPDDPQPSQSALGFARVYGVNPDDPADPYLRAVRRAIAEAVMKHGTGARGDQIFRDYPGAGTDAQLWDDTRVPRHDKEYLLAGMRADRARRESGQGNGHARIGLASPVASGVT